MARLIIKPNSCQQADDKLLEGKKKVLFIAGHVLTLRLFRMELIERLLVDGWRVTVVVPLDGTENPFPGCETVDIPVDRRGTNPLRDIRLFLRYRALIKKINPHTVLTYTIKPNLYGGLACLLSRTPQLANVTGLGSGFSGNGWVSVFVRVLSRFVFRRAHTVFVQNDYIMAVLQEHGMLCGNGVLIPGSGVNIDCFVPAPYPPEDAPVIFHFVARVMREKGIGEYLEAARRIRGAYPETVFRVIGSIEESEWESTLYKAQTEGVIWYMGFRDDMPTLTAECACVVNPSYHEGLSNVLLESAACARPLIASDVPGCRECLEDGVTGLLCRAQDADSLVDVIKRFLAIPYEQRIRMGQAGRAKMEREFDRERVVETYMERLRR